MDAIITSVLGNAPWLAGFLLLAFVQWRVYSGMSVRLDSAEKRYDDLVMYALEHTDIDAKTIGEVANGSGLKDKT